MEDRPQLQPQQPRLETGMKHHPKGHKVHVQIPGELYTIYSDTLRCQISTIEVLINFTKIGPPFTSN